MKRGFFNKKDIQVSDIAHDGREAIDNLRRQLTECLHVKNDMNMAEKLCNEILAVDPYHHEYLLKRALIRETLNKDVDALKDAALYQYMHPFNLEALSLQARLLEKTGSHAAALRVLKLLMAFDKDDLLKEEYDKVQAMSKKVKKVKKKKKNKQKKEQDTRTRSKGINKITHQTTLDEDGTIILEEEKILRATEPSTIIKEPINIEHSTSFKYGISFYITQ
jgi:tetratricopeptide (TPR) repeat protein